jgi:DNA-binding phage protein
LKKQKNPKTLKPQLTFNRLTHRNSDTPDLNAKTLYRTLSAHGNPEMKSLMAILKAMGMRLAVEPIEAAHA